MKSIIGEIWRIPHRGVIINGDDEKDYVLLCDQKSAISSSHFFYGCVL